MSRSNLQFKSNLYCLAYGGKYSAEYVSKVTDAKTLRQISRRGTGMMLDWQKSAAEHAASCSKGQEGNDFHTHGVITENGTKMFVCKCQHERCPSYAECSSKDNFRKVAISYNPMSKPAVEVARKNKDMAKYEYYGDVQPPKVEKAAPSVRVDSAEAKYATNEITPYNRVAENWSVRGHYRRLSDGTETWVQSHTRGANQFGYEHPDNLLGGDKLLEQYRPEIEDDFDVIPKVEDEKTPDYVLKNLVPIDDAKTVIESPIDERVLVNGGAGTGKTHTVVERLKYILRNNLADPSGIYVLCFSRSAVKVIRNRLKEEIDKGDLSFNANEIEIRTFDSFATWCLKEDEGIDLRYYDYERRIAKFIEEFLKDASSFDEGIKYLIVDEIQDLVGQRAEMVRCLLDKLSCGFLLLGDQCQAIYDYLITNDYELNASKFFEWLDNRFKSELHRYELVKNYRQLTDLQDEITPLRKAMLNEEAVSQVKELKKIVKNHATHLPAMEVLGTLEGRSALLSWSNGDAYRQSQDLFMQAEPIEHQLLTGSRRTTFTKELAFIFSEYEERLITKRVFFDLAKKAFIEEGMVESLWQALARLASKSDGTIELDLVKKSLLWQKFVDDVLLNIKDDNITVSTIHKAKGKEYDNVLVNVTDLGAKSDAAEIKVYYVALTRARNKLHTTSKRRVFDRKSNDGRFFRNCEEFGRWKLTRLELGMDGDIDYTSFVDKELFNGDNGAQKNQEYISKNVKRGDALSIWLINGRYLIKHDGNTIGAMNPNVFNDFSYNYKEFQFTQSFAEINRYETVFVRDIITVVNRGTAPNIAEPYSRSGFWLGVDFCGYSHPYKE